jgi:hypothetical protein
MLLINPHTLSFSFEVPEMDETEGVQKILGFSRGWHHWNSVRLGASASVGNGDVRLFNYSYIKGKRVIEPIGNDVFEPKTILKCAIVWNIGFSNVRLYNEHDYFISCQRIRFDMFNACKLSYLLHPYFETDAPENKVIPFDVKIWDVRVNGRMIEL